MMSHLTTMVQGEEGLVGTVEREPMVPGESMRLQELATPKVEISSLYEAEVEEEEEAGTASVMEAVEAVQFRFPAENASISLLLEE